MKKYGNPLIVLLAGNFLIGIMKTYVQIPLIDEILAVCTSVMFFAFGYTLNTPSRIIRKTAWIRKLLAIALFIVLVVYSLGYIDIPVSSEILDMIGFGRIFIYMRYIYFGFAFAS